MDLCRTQVGWILKLQTYLSIVSLEAFGSQRSVPVFDSRIPNNKNALKNIIQNRFANTVEPR